MAKNKSKANKIVSALVLLLAIVIVVMGIVGTTSRNAASGQKYLDEMRDRAVLVATGEGAVESYVKIAADKAREETKAAGGGMSEIRKAVAEAEENARANSSANMLDYATIDITNLNAALDEMHVALTAYYAEEAAAQEAYVASMGTAVQEEVVEEIDTAEMTSEADLEAALTEEEPAVDLSGFVATAEMNQLMAAAEGKYVVVGAALMELYEALDESAVQTLKGTIMSLVAQSKDDYASSFDRYAATGGLAGVENKLSARMVRYGDDLIYIGIGLVVLAAVIVFYL